MPSNSLANEHSWRFAENPFLLKRLEDLGVQWVVSMCLQVRGGFVPSEQKSSQSALDLVSKEILHVARAARMRSTSRKDNTVLRRRLPLCGVGIAGCLVRGRRLWRRIRW